MGTNINIFWCRWIPASSLDSQPRRWIPASWIMASLPLLLVHALGGVLGLTIPEAKVALRTALAAHAGNTKEPAVAAAVADLAELCPYDAPAREAALLGPWVQINSPEYSGGTQAPDGAFQYTLGRLSFGIFQPKELVCTLGPIGNPLKPSSEVGVVDYEIVVPMSIECATGPLPAQLVNFAKCSAESDTRLAVEFSGGVLKPDADCDREAWRRTFAPALAAKPGKRARLMDWLMGKMMGLVKPKEMGADAALTYQMNKAPKGFLDVLFLDEELRITKGNRGSLVVAERAAE